MCICDQHWLHGGFQPYKFGDSSFHAWTRIGQVEEEVPLPQAGSHAQGPSASTRYLGLMITMQSMLRSA